LSRWKFGSISTDAGEAIEHFLNGRSNDAQSIQDPWPSRNSFCLERHDVARQGGYRVGDLRLVHRKCSAWPHFERARIEQMSSAARRCLVRALR
jgi:hypothetical protein